MDLIPEITDFKPVDVILWYDGPCLFTIRDVKGDLYLLCALDFADDGDYFALLPNVPGLVEDIDLLDHSNTIGLVYIPRKGTPSVTRASVDDLKADGFL